MDSISQTKEINIIPKNISDISVKLSSNSLSLTDLLNIMLPFFKNLAYRWFSKLHRYRRESIPIMMSYLAVHVSFRGNALRKGTNQPVLVRPAMRE